MLKKIDDLSVAWVPIIYEANSFKRLEENKVA
jgi:hypothetical protein